MNRDWCLLPWTAVLHDWATTVDHKKIGILYILMSLVFLVIAGCEALLMRWQLFYPRSNFLAPDTFNQLFTMHGTTMVFFVGMPILIGMGNYLVPSDDRCEGHGLPASECLWFLVDAVRWPAGVLQLCHRRCSRHGLVCLCTAHRAHVRPWAGHRFLGAWA